ncbi:hypothetical protein [Micromonospora sp. GCM10011541]|uniref:hypothetical protein n=1 Tax=Micromonospora sp. GCM10011541 TaxID=3317336 RepID=UPI00362352C4
MAETGTIIGRVSVKVMPDTSKFRREAQEALETISKSLKVEAKVIPKVDESLAKAEAKKLQKEIQGTLGDINIRVNMDNHDSVLAGIKQLEREMEKLDEIVIPVTLNKDELEKKIAGLKAVLKAAPIKIDVQPNDASIKKALAQIEAEIERLQPVSTVEVEPNLSSLLKTKAMLEQQLRVKAVVKAEMDKVAAKFVRDRIEKALADIPVNTKLDKKSVAKTMREIEGLLDQMEDLKAKITPEIDARAKAKVEREIEDLQDKIDDLKAKIKPEISQPFLIKAAATLALLARNRFVEIFPKVNAEALAGAIAGLSGIRVVNSLFEKFANTLMNLDKAVPVIGGISLAIMGIGGAAIQSIASLAALAVSLAQIGPAALLLPGLFAGMAIGLGVLVVAFKDFNTVLPDIKQHLSELADQMSSNFWAKAKEPINELVHALLPQFSAGLKLVSTSMGEFFGKLADSFKGALGGDVVTGMFANLNEAIVIAGGSTDSLANIVKILGEVGSAYLPKLAQWFVDITDKFSGFLTDAKADGSLQEWIDTALTNLGALGSALWSIGSIFLSIGQAAMGGGAGGITGMAASLKSVADAAKDPAFQGGLASFFATINSAMSQITSIGGPALMALFANLPNIIGGPLQSAGTAIGHLVSSVATALNNPAIANGLSMMMDGLMRGIIALDPAIQSLAPVLGGLGTIIGTLAANLGPLISTILPPLAGLFTALLPSINTLAGVLGGTLLAAFQKIMPALQPVFDQMTKFAPILTEQLAPILQLIGTLFSELVVAIAPLVKTFMAMYQQILPPLLKIIKQIIEENMGPLIEAVKKLVAALQPVITAIGVVVGWLLNFLAPVIVFVAGLIIDILIMAIDGIARVFEAVVGIVMGIWNTFAGLFTGDWGRMWDGIKQIFSSLWNGIVGIFEVIIAWFGGTAIKGLFKGVSAGWTAGWNAVKKFFTDFIAGLKSFAQKSFDEWVQLISTALKAIGKWFKDTWKSVTEGVSNAFKSVVKFFDDGLRGAKDKTMSGLKAVKDFFVDMGKNITKTVRDKFNEVVSLMTKAFKDPLGLLKDIGKKIIDGLIAGLRSGFDLVKSTLSGLTEWIKDWKGPESYDKVLLTPAGKMIIDGFIEGLESRYGDVRKSLRGLTKDVAGTEFAIPGVNSGMSARLAGALDGTATDGVVQKVLNYYAATGSSLDSEEDLFLAAGRARMVGW